VQDLAVEQVGSVIEIRFTLPTESVDGEDLTKPLEVEVFRGTAAPGLAKESQQPSPTVFGQSWLSLKPADLGRPDAEGKVQYAAQVPAAEFKSSIGQTIHFELRTLTRGFRGRPIESDPSNIAALTVLDVPRPVTGVTAQTTRAALELHWSAPTETLTGRPASSISAYRVYRSERDPASAAKTAAYRLIAETHDTSYEDVNFQFGRSYSFKVRAVVSATGRQAESQDSAAAEVTPHDVFAPAIPAGLAGLYTSGAVEVIWSPNLERDLAGYNLLRREDGGQPKRLNQELLRSPLYRDTDVTQGHHYFYEVTAVDLSGNESQPSSEIEVDVPEQSN
jgi:hypothetical protein